MARRRNKSSTSPSGTLSSVWGFVVWVVGVLVSLAVGFGMVEGILVIPKIPEIVTMTAGWFVVILTVLGVILKIIDAVS